MSNTNNNPHTDNNDYTQTFNDIYSQAIDHAIEVVKIYSNDAWKLTEPYNHLGETAFQKIISNLEQLKNNFTKPNPLIQSN